MRWLDHNEIIRLSRNIHLLFDLDAFRKLSQDVYHSLGYRDPANDLYCVLPTIVEGNEKLTSRETAVMKEALNYLIESYAGRERRTGHPAVLHPIRAAALLTRAGPLEKTGLLDLLSAMFHDILEDLRPDDIDRRLYALLEPEERDIVARRLDRLTRRVADKGATGWGETYYQYIGRLLEAESALPGLVRLKLADRLDNTLDMRIDGQDPWQGLDFFRRVFHTLFLSGYSGEEPQVDHPSFSPINGANRLYQLFKNTVLLTLVRQHGGVKKDPVALTLFEAVAAAGLREAQSIFLHIVSYHYQDVSDQRSILMEIMEYTSGGGSDEITPISDRPLDGLFEEYFDHTETGARGRALERLYQDKTLMISAALNFVVIFSKYMNDATHVVQGISSEGIEAPHSGGAA